MIERDDGYLQDLASQWVDRARWAPTPGERVVDLCAAPGGKATGLAAAGAAVAALDCTRPGPGWSPPTPGGSARRTCWSSPADGRRPPLRPGSRPGPGRRALLGPRLVAPPGRRPLAHRARRRRPPGRRCSGGLLDAAVAAGAPRRRARLQVCTLTAAETLGHRPAGWPRPIPTSSPWRPWATTWSPRAWPTAAACWCCPRPPAPTACSCCGCGR